MFELRPSSNNIHDTFLTGAAQGTTQLDISPSVTYHRRHSSLFNFHELQYGSFYGMLTGKGPFCEKNRLSDCHTFIARRFIVLSFKH